LTEFTQLYLTPKIFLMGSSLAFSLKEDPVRCAKVCNKSWVILLLQLFFMESRDGLAVLLQRSWPSKNA
jgi:hypothetical protein